MLPFKNNNKNFPLTNKTVLRKILLKINKKFEKLNKIKMLI